MEKNIKQIARTISKFSTSEIDELSSILTHTYGIHANIYRYTAGILSTDEPTTATVFLRKTGGQKLLLVKTLKEYLGIGLREAKDTVDNAPCVVIEDTSIENAETLKDALEECGAVVEIH
jgi:large subunit ribosomal protein L7/L12